MTSSPRRTGLRHRISVATAGILAALVLLAAVGVTSSGFVRRGLDADGVVTVLLLGSDMGPLRDADPMTGRADAFHLAVMAGPQRAATIVNVPRDSWVEVSGMGETKINDCLTAGPRTCVATVEQLWGIEVDGWMVTDFTAFKAAVQAFGGVVVDVEHSLDDGGPAIEPGLQRLDGARSLTYVRDRKSRPEGDFDRTHAQGNFLRAALQTLVSDGVSLRRASEVARILASSTVADLRPDLLLRLAYLAVTLDADSVHNVTLPGRAGWAGSRSVVYLDPEADAIVRDIAEDALPPG